MWLIDDEGGFWSDCGTLRARLGIDLDGQGLIRYVVENLGYVAIKQHTTSVQVTLRPRAVSQPTLAAVLYWLVDQSLDRVVISRLDVRWHHEVLPAQSAPARLGQLIVDPKIIRSSDFRRRRCNRVLSGPLVALMQSWQDDPRAPFSGRACELLQRGLGGRYMILTQAQWSRRLEIVDVGRGFIVYDDAWLSRAVGLRFEDQPDYLYGKWASEAYYEASDTAQAIADDVDALIDRPGRGKIRVQYQRLILPFRDRTGDQLLFCASAIDREINLRVEGLREQVNVLE